MNSREVTLHTDEYSKLELTLGLRCGIQQGGEQRLLKPEMLPKIHQINRIISLF